MPKIPNPYVDEETGEKWKLVKSDPGPPYIYWLNYYTHKDREHPWSSIPFTPSAEAWLKRIRKERRQDESQTASLD